MRYLSRLWPRRDEIVDLRQEIYARVYDAARKARPASPKSFLFTTARHLMTDRARRSRVVFIDAIGDPDVFNVMVDELSPERRMSAWQELKRLNRALNRLPAKCREVVWLRKVDELSPQQIAEKLGLSVRTVEGQILKGMRRVTDMMFGGPRTAASQDGLSEDDDEAENQHGKR